MTWTAFLSSSSCTGTDFTVLTWTPAVQQNYHPEDVLCLTFGELLTVTTAFKWICPAGGWSTSSRCAFSSLWNSLFTHTEMKCAHMWSLSAGWQLKPLMSPEQLFVSVLDTMWRRQSYSFYAPCLSAACFGCLSRIKLSHFLPWKSCCWSHSHLPHPLIQAPFICFPTSSTVCESKGWQKSVRLSRSLGNISDRRSCLGTRLSTHLLKGGGWVFVFLFSSGLASDIRSLGASHFWEGKCNPWLTLKKFRINQRHGEVIQHHYNRNQGGDKIKGLEAGNYFVEKIKNEMKYNRHVKI